MVQKGLCHEEIVRRQSLCATDFLELRQFGLNAWNQHAYTHMRLTEDMIDAMGGRHSEAFRYFRTCAQTSYEALRPHASFWYHLLSAEYFIFKDHDRHWRRIRNHILNRFVPGEWNDEASLHIEAVVDKAARFSWTQQFTDFTHAASNRMGEMFQMEL